MGSGRKRKNMFDGMSEEEVCQLKLPDRLRADLDILVVGINPGMFSAYKGHHYAKPGNHFWKCLYLSGLTPRQLSASEDETLPGLGIGLTNIVERTTRSSSDLDKKEIQAGAEILVVKINKLRPKIAVFNGKQIYEVFSGKKKFNLGLQPELVQGTNYTHIWVMPSSSGRCTTPCRAEDKVPYYVALKKFRDYLNGHLSEIDEKELVFAPLKMQKIHKNEYKESLYFKNQLNDGDDKCLDRKKETLTKKPKQK
ncbi:G/T mismatch-specific thymine DNA glycosylase-like [Cimex lectularius]|uniref:G/T mismatch-specific thymine DNA glycosylase n=1 Tax=Cimex lectularius TaxID=79782 RepID=A0A8I6RWF5_CIMLE|nr:G/T mismatch-specific thymine DNA glycosylase-like [Cimex lectularius]